MIEDGAAIPVVVVLPAPEIGRHRSSAFDHGGSGRAGRQRALTLSRKIRRSRAAAKVSMQ